VEDITTADVDTLRERLLLGELSPRRDNEPRALTHKTVQKVMTLLGGVMGRAERKGWIASNPCEHAERVSVPRGDEFNVLSVEQVHCVARAADDVVLSALFIVAAFTGLRQGELLALRWRHVDFGNRICTSGAISPPVPRRRTRPNRIACAASRSPIRRSSRSPRSAGARTSPAMTISCSRPPSVGI
jgi:integrase